jgi:hypothetical protein
MCRSAFNAGTCIEEFHNMRNLISKRMTAAQKTKDFSLEQPTVYLVFQYRGGPGSNPGLVMWDFVMDTSGAGADFLRELQFPLPIYIPSASPQSSSPSPEACTLGQECPQCQ